MISHTQTIAICDFVQTPAPLLIRPCMCWPARFLAFVRNFKPPLNDFSNRWCKRENVEPDALEE